MRVPPLLLGDVFRAQGTKHISLPLSTGIHAKAQSLPGTLDSTEPWKYFVFPLYIHTHNKLGKRLTTITIKQTTLTIHVDNSYANGSGVISKGNKDDWNTTL